MPRPLRRAQWPPAALAIPDLAAWIFSAYFSGIRVDFHPPACVIGFPVHPASKVPNSPLRYGENCEFARSQQRHCRRLTSIF
jgi:hypothetical protein